MSLFFEVNYQSFNFTISDFEHPQLEAVKKYLSPVVLGLTTIVAITFVYVAFTQSPKPMKAYSYLLIYHVGVLYNFDVLLFVFQPIFIFPYLGFYTNSFLDYGETGTMYLALLFAANIVLLYHIVHVQEFYRLAALYPPNSFIFKFTKSRLLILVFLPILIFLLCALMCKLFWVFIKNFTHVLHTETHVYTRVSVCCMLYNIFFCMVILDVYWQLLI